MANKESKKLIIEIDEDGVITIKNGDHIIFTSTDEKTQFNFLTKEQIQTYILEKLEKQGYRIDLADSKEHQNAIIIEELREFFKKVWSNNDLPETIIALTKDQLLSRNCHLLKFITKWLINSVFLEKNIFKVIGYQREIENVLDLIIYVNGIPLIIWKIGEENTSLETIYEQLQKECQNFQNIYSFK